MQLTTINKFVSLVLTGSLALGLALGIGWWSSTAPEPEEAEGTSTAVESVAAPDGEAGGTAGEVDEVAGGALADERWATLLTGLTNAPVAVLSLLFLSAAALIGALLEGLTALTIRRLLERTVAEKPRFAKFLGKGPFAQRYESWRTQFTNAMNAKRPTYQDVGAILADPNLRRGLATLICYTYANDQHAGRSMSHYAIFVFLSNLVLIALLAGFGLAFAPNVTSGWPASVGLVVVGLAVAWVIATIALEFCIYSYEVVYRYAYLWACEPASRTQNSTAAPAGAGAPPVGGATAADASDASGN